MPAGYQDVKLQLDPESRTLVARFRLVNQSGQIWRSDDVSLGWQVFDPETGTFIFEGVWTPIGVDLAPAETREFAVEVQLPPERGRYHVYLSPIHSSQGWFYHRGQPFLLLDVVVENHCAELLETSVTTIRALRRKQRRFRLKRLFTHPLNSIWQNRSLIRSMVRRDIHARYKGSFGDVLWTVLNPLLLMATYFFVFGLVLQSRFGPDQSRTGFVLYFLAGMLPWLAFSEAVGRAPYVIVEHRNFVKKLVFPVDILSVTQVISGLVTQAFATAIFLIVLLAIRGTIPPTVFWIPVLLVPQLLFALGLSWFLAALGVYLRDLGQVIGFLLTLWFFLTPICYPESSFASLPPLATALLGKNPIYVLVQGYRRIFLEGLAPVLGPTWKLWVLAIVVFFAGHAWFYKLRRSFADVI